jgi:predicted O-linked N-acetylglucosamine transferase (SPINDLY family)
LRLGAKKRKQGQPRAAVTARDGTASTLQRADQCYTTGDLPTAARLYRDVLEREPSNHKAVFMLGMIEHQRNAHAAARELFERAVALNATAPYSWHYLGRTLQALGDHAAALVHFKRARQLDPNLLEAWLCEGRLFRAVGALAQAESTYAAAAELHPRAALPVEHLGELELSRGRLEQAAEYFQRAAELDPQLIAPVVNLGVVHQRSGRLEQSGACYERAIQLDPSSVVAHANLGWIENKRGFLAAAEQHLRRAVSLDPNYAAAWIDLASVLHELGEVSEAIGCYRQALARAPNAANHSSLIALMLYDVESSPRAVLDEARRWAELYAPESAKEPLDRPALASALRLRIGYVSPDFRQHSVAHFSEPLITAHDPSRFEVFCYSNSQARDDVAARIEARAQLRVIRDRTDAEVAAQIRADGIHILVDLAGHTADNRLALFGRRPAPIQATYVGYPGTTGVSAIDYRFTDALADPEPSADAEYSEQLVRLPGAFCCFRPPDRAPRVNALPALESGYITFGSLNNYTKLSASVFETWSRILGRIPDARLVLQSRPFADPAIRERVWSRFAVLGVSRERVDLHGAMPVESHLALYNQIDIGLDTFPWNGHTTTLLALHMGVPVVALTGDRFGGRMGLSVLTNAGLTDWIATDRDHYVELAVDRARDRTGLCQLRQQLRAQLANSPLCDAAAFAQGMEAAYEALWRECGQARNDA